MCGGYTIAKSIEKIKQRFNVDFRGSGAVPKFNARPSQLLPIITMEDPSHVTLAHWGLFPVWAEKMGLKKEIINTRMESLSKPSFRSDFKNRRCLVISDGFIEWEKQGDLKMPIRFGRGNFELFAMAGLYENDAELGPRFSIITTEPNNAVKKIHNRMPVMLAEGSESKWLEGVDLDSLLIPYSGKDFTSVHVSRKINVPFNDFPEVLEVENI